MCEAKDCVKQPYYGKHFTIQLWVIRKISSEHLMYRIVTIDNNTVWYTSNLPRVALKLSYYTDTQKVTMWGDRYVNELDCDYHFTMYMHITSSQCTL